MPIDQICPFLSFNDLISGSRYYTRVTAYNERGFAQVSSVASEVVLGQPRILGGVFSSVDSESFLIVFCLPYFLTLLPTD